jgi:alkane 1-monooxygenase
MPLSIGLMIWTENRFFPFWFLFLLSPILKYFFTDHKEVHPESIKKFSADRRFSIPLHLVVYISTISWIMCLIVVSDKIEIDHWIAKRVNPKTIKQFIGLALSCATFSGLDIIAGHELFHRREWFDKFVGSWTYTKWFYTHFIDEHLSGHHKLIATPEDPATARYNENVYHFVIRSLIGG